jgi:hypothetical protein
MAGLEADMPAPGLAFSIIIVLVLLVLVYAAFRLFCSTKGQIAGYWTSPDGDLFEVWRVAAPAGSPGAPQKGDYVVATASGFLGAATGGVYPVTKKGCRSVSIPFPNGELRGVVGLDRRRIIWDYAPPWYRQGI